MITKIKETIQKSIGFSFNIVVLSLKQELLLYIYKP